MSLDQNHNSLFQVWGNFQKAWRKVCEEWDDNVRNRFERDYWNNVRSTVPGYLKSLEELAQTIHQARQSIH